MCDFSEQLVLEQCLLLRLSKQEEEAEQVGKMMQRKVRESYFDP